MSLHFLDPDREARDCPRVWSAYLPGDETRILEKDDHPKKCQCSGTGRLGVEGAEAEIEVCEYFMDDKSIGWFWREAGNDEVCGNPIGHDAVRPFTTEALALAAARAALKEETS